MNGRRNAKYAINHCHSSLNHSCGVGRPGSINRCCKLAEGLGNGLTTSDNSRLELDQVCELLEALIDRASVTRGHVAGKGHLNSSLDAETVQEIQ